MRKNLNALYIALSHQAVINVLARVDVNVSAILGGEQQRKH